MHRGAGELADRHLQRRDRAHGQAGEEHGGRVTERDAEHGECRDEVAATLDADEQGDADEADADADQPRPGDALADVHPRGEDDGEDRRRRLDHGRQAGVEVRLGEAEQPEGHGVVEGPEHDDRPEVAAERGEAAAARKQREQEEQRSAPKTSRPNATTDGSSVSTPSLMKRNDDPQIAERSSRREASRRVTAS